MPAPKGTRDKAFLVNSTDSVHVYSKVGEIWLQLRRNVRTLDDIGEPSFKTTLSLTPTQAEAIGEELRIAAMAQKAARKSAQATRAAPVAKDTVPVEPTAAELTERGLAHLRRSPTNCPKTKKSLIRHLRTQVLKGISAVKMEQVIARLQSEGHITIKGKSENVTCLWTV